MYVSWVQIENPDAIHEPAMHYVRPEFFPMNVHFKLFALSKQKNVLFCEKFYGPITTFPSSQKENVESSFKIIVML